MDINALQQQFASMGSAVSLNGSRGGNMADFQEMAKALQAGSTHNNGYNTDVTDLKGGGALGVQSLDTAMKTTIQENQHFTLFNRLAQSSATNIVDEYTRQSSVGGFLGGSTNSQMGEVRAANGDYSREVGFVKFLMTLRQVGYVLNIGKNIAEPIAVEERNGALQLLTDANYLLYHGNSKVVGTQFDGVFAQIDEAIKNKQMPDECRINQDGRPLNSVEPFSKINVAVSSYGSWGRSTDVFLPNSVQNDLNMGLDPAFRWVEDGTNIPVIGGHVPGIRLTNGILKTNMDTFIHDETNPMTHVFELSNMPIANKVTDKMKTFTVTPAKAGVDSISKFTGKRAGTSVGYAYAVAAISATGAGIGKAVIVGAQTVANGDGIKLTMTHPTGGDLGGFAIYRGRQDVAVDPTIVASSDDQVREPVLRDMRLVAMIPASTGSSTVFNDYNLDIPGTVSVPLLNLGQGADAIGWRQFQPMTKIDLPFGVGGVPVHSWFQFLFGYLRMTKPKHHGYIKNVLPAHAEWRPHTGE